MSKFKVGDKVRFLNDVGSGVVTRILDQEMVMVRNEDDWEIPTLIKELIPNKLGFYSSEDRKSEPVSPPPNRVINKVELVEEKQSILADEIEKGQKEKVFEPGKIQVAKPLGEANFFIGFIPSNPKNIIESDIEAYLINDSGFNLLFHYAIKFEGRSISREAGLLEADTKLFLEKYQRKDLNQLNGLHIQIIQYQPHSVFIPMPPKEFELQIQSIKFFKTGSFSENDFFYEPAIIFPLKKKGNETIEEEISKLSINKEEDKPKTLAARKSTVANNASIFDTVEVDLHIEKLASNSENLNNLEILGIQMDKFQLEMGKAIRDGSRRIVFIHGVGNGILKLEIAKELKHKYKHFQFQDASFMEYGYGATLVMLRK